MNLQKLKVWLEIISGKAWERMKEELKKYPEYTSRSLLLIFGRERAHFYIHITPDGPRILFTEPNCSATLKARMDFSVLYDILNKRYSVDYAISKGWIELDSDTPEGWFYHYTIVRRYIGHLTQAYQELKGGSK